MKEQLGSAMEQIAESFAPLRDARLFMTGGSGFFGQWLLSAIDCLNVERGFNISVSVLTRQPDALRMHVPFVSGSHLLKMIEGDVRSFTASPGPFDFLVHGATTSAHETFSGTSSLEKFDLLVDGTRRVMDFAQGRGIKKALFLSSGVVYGTPSVHGPLNEDETNAPPTTHTATGLAQGKRAAEYIFMERSRAHHIEPVIARCFSFVGAGLPHDIHYAIGNFVAAAVRNDDIIIHSDGSAVRSYMDMRDFVVWFGYLLGKTGAHAVYNVGSDHAISIKDLAALVARVIGSSSQIIVKGDASHSVGNAVRNTYVPAVERFMSEYSPPALVSLETSIKDYAASLRS